MPELAGVLIAGLLGVGVAVPLSRRARRGDLERPGLDRLLNAARRASRDFLRQTEWRLSLMLLFGLMGWLVTRGLGPVTAEALGLGWKVAALIAGALSTVAVAHLAKALTERSMSSSLSVLSAGRGATPGPSLVGTAAVGAVVDATSLITTLLVFGGGLLALLADAPSGSSALPFEASRLLPLAALGSISAAAVYQVGGASFHAAAGVAARTLATEREREDERHVGGTHRNPTLVAELVGSTVGASVSRATDAFATLLFANGTLVCVASAISRDHAASGEAALAIAALPLLVRAGGLLAFASSATQLRPDSGGDPIRALLATGASSGLLLTAVLFGATYWLVGEPHFLWLAAAGSLGLLASWASRACSVWLERSGSAALLTPGLNALTRNETSLARAFGMGLQQTWPPLVTVGLCMGGSWACGARLPVPHGGELALALGVAALLGSTAMNLAQDLLPGVARSVLLASTLPDSGFDEGALTRARDFHRWCDRLGNHGRMQLILGAACTALLAALTLPVTSLAEPLSPDGELMHPALLVGGLLGAAHLSFFIGSALQSATRAAHYVGRELSQQLRLSATPSAQRYGPAVTLASESAKGSIVPLALLAVGAPLAIVTSFGLVYANGHSPVATQGLMSYALVATLTGCCAALAAHGAVAALSSATLESLRPSPAAGQFMERSVGPAALLALKAIVIAAIAANTPFSV